MLPYERKVFPNMLYFYILIFVYLRTPYRVQTVYHNYEIRQSVKGQPQKANNDAI